MVKELSEDCGHLTVEGVVWGIVTLIQKSRVAL